MVVGQNFEFVKTEWFEASNIPGVKYKLRMYPNGYIDEHRNETWVSLNVSIGKEVEVQADYQISIESAGLNIKLNYKYIEDTGFGSKCCDTTVLLNPRFIVDGKLTIKCDGILTVKREGKTPPAKWETEGFLKNIWNRSDKDFTIIVGEEIIQVSFFVIYSSLEK